MITKTTKNPTPLKTHPPLRPKLSPTPQTPPLNLFPSNNNIYPQLIHHLNPLTLLTPSTLDKHLNIHNTSHTPPATKLRQLLPKPPLQKPI
ncbi:50S ribosomal protein L18, partial [Bacillus sp. WP8]|uniref:50S ribosomal protein L18 n=1 Tax=Bacillus sp. WP8 TaxID=756828 RepID=UPI0011A7E9B5